MLKKLSASFLIPIAFISEIFGADLSHPTDIVRALKNKSRTYTSAGEWDDLPRQALLDSLIKRQSALLKNEEIINAIMEIAEDIETPVQTKNFAFSALAATESAFINSRLRALEKNNKFLEYSYPKQSKRRIHTEHAWSLRHSLKLAIFKTDPLLDLEELLSFLTTSLDRMRRGNHDTNSLEFISLLTQFLDNPAAIKFIESQIRTLDPSDSATMRETMRESVEWENLLIQMSDPLKAWEIISAVQNHVSLPKATHAVGAKLYDCLKKLSNLARHPEN